MSFCRSTRFFLRPNGARNFPQGLPYFFNSRFTVVLFHFAPECCSLPNKSNDLDCGNTKPSASGKTLKIEHYLFHLREIVPGPCFVSAHAYCRQDARRNNWLLVMLFVGSSQTTSERMGGVRTGLVSPPTTPGGSFRRRTCLVRIPAMIRPGHSFPCHVANGCPGQL